MEKLMKVQKGLEVLGYTVKVFDDKDGAAEYLSGALQGKRIGLGGSASIGEMGLYERLQERNTVLWHLRLSAGDDVMQVRKDAARAEVYITSVNGISEAGEIVNIDNTGNRVAAATFGCEKVYFIIGKNKIAPTLAAAIDRARNIAAPLNAKRLGLKTPCAVRGDRCYDCDSPQRICRNLSVFWRKPTGCEYEVLLINETLGY